MRKEPDCDDDIWNISVTDIHSVTVNHVIIATVKLLK